MPGLGKMSQRSSAHHSGPPGLPLFLLLLLQRWPSALWSSHTLPPTAGLCQTLPGCPQHHEELTTQGMLNKHCFNKLKLNNYNI